MAPKRIPIEDRYWANVNKVEGDCWIWTGAKRNYKGYGTIALPGRGNGSITTHRFAWKLAFGDIPEGLHVLHKCDNPSCVNPEHLFLGTNNDNVQDKCKKGRLNHVKGEKSGVSKLTEKDILLIKQLRKDGLLHREIAEKLNITKGNVGFILRGETWKHVL